MFRSILAASLMAAAAFGATGAYAQDDTSVSISTRNVDFNNPTAVHKLYGQIRDAADAVCDQTTGSMFAAKREKACTDAAVDAAVTNLNQPQLTQLARHRYNDSQLAMRDRHDQDMHGTR